MPEIIDLTYTIEEGMITFQAPWHPPVSIQQLGRLDFEGRETKKITLGTHTGTHLDAPLHFIKGGKSIDEIPLDKLMGKVTIVDFSHLRENGAITKEMLEKVPVTKRILFKFGWGKHWNTGKFYQNHPFFTKEAALYLIDHGVELIGMDTPSPDDSRQTNKDVDSPIHKIFLRNGVLLAEYVANLEKVDTYDDWSILVMPLKIKGSDGAPARICIYREE
jgi:arylformamidase